MAIATQLVKDINDSHVYRRFQSVQFCGSGERYLFHCHVSCHGTGIVENRWDCRRYTLVKDILPVAAVPIHASLTNVGGTLFFGVYDNTDFKTELWKSDGTTAGTVPVVVSDPEFSLVTPTISPPLMERFTFQPAAQMAMNFGSPTAQQRAPQW